jgi:glutamate 5-kinase
MKRIVVKLGTNILRSEDGNVSLPRVFSFIEDISRLVRNGKEVIIVTSGAVGLGKKRLGLESTKETVLKQVCAAVGQGKLMSIYESGFDSYGLVCAQVLLTEEDFTVCERYSTLCATMNKLLEFGVVPVINQNDAVSVRELAPIDKAKPGHFSDNDKLSALVASELDADLLLILSDIDGLYDANPKTNPAAQKIDFVDEVTDEIYALGSDASEGGTGGMRTKLEAARLVTRTGAQVIIANGMEPFVIKRIFEGEKLGTQFGGGQMYRKTNQCDNQGGGEDV